MEKKLSALNLLNNLLNLGMKFTKNIFGFFLALFIFLGAIIPVSAATNGPTGQYSFSAAPGPRSGTIKLIWYDDSTVKQYNLSYGFDQSKYIYGVVDLPRTPNRATEFLIEYLTPGQTYYFTLYGVKNDGTGNESGPVMSKAASANNIQTAKSTYYTNDHPTIPYAFSLNYGNKGEVILSWIDNGTADKYDVVYGTKAGNYIYGFQGMPFTMNSKNTFTVGALSPGTTYYFALVTERNNSVISWSEPLSITAR